MLQPAYVAKKDGLCCYEPFASTVPQVARGVSWVLIRFVLVTKIQDIRVVI